MGGGSFLSVIFMQYTSDLKIVQNCKNTVQANRQKERERRDKNTDCLAAPIQRNKIQKEPTLLLIKRCSIPRSDYVLLCGYATIWYDSE